MVTLRDIAKECGFSKTAVWLALSDNPRIPEKTRLTIKEAAKRMGYSPNPAYRRMLKQVREGRSVSYRSTLAILHGFDIPDPEDHDPYHHDLVNGATRRAEEQGYKVEKFWLKLPKLRGSRLSQILEARGIQGVIITPFPKHLKLHLEWEKFAAVTIGYTLTEPRLNRIEVNNHAGMALCLKKCLEYGYDRVGLVMRPDHELSRRYEFTSPYYAYQAAKPREERTEPLLVDSRNPGSFWEWQKQYRFNAIITTHTCVVDWLLEAGVRVPEEVGIVFPTPVYDYSEYAHVNQMPYRIGAGVADMLIAQLNRREFGCPENPKTNRTDVAWFDGPSLCQYGKPHTVEILDSIF